MKKIGKISKDSVRTLIVGSMSLSLFATGCFLGYFSDQMFGKSIFYELINYFLAGMCFIGGAITLIICFISICSNKDKAKGM